MAVIKPCLRVSKSFTVTFQVTLPALVIIQVITWSAVIKPCYHTHNLLIDDMVGCHEILLLACIICYQTLLITPTSCTSLGFYQTLLPQFHNILSDKSVGCHHILLLAYIIFKTYSIVGCYQMPYQS